MVSLFIFALVALIFSGTISASLRAGRLNGQYAQATSLCQHKIDQMRAVGFGRLNYTELSDAGIIDDDPSSQPFSFAQVDDVASYLPQASTSIRIETVDSSVVKVTVSISWKKVAHESKVSTMSIYALIANAE
jgi:hypothetical protein